MFKNANKLNNPAFKSVPREYYSNQEEAIEATKPGVGEYRPRFGYVEPKVKGKIQYGSKS